MEITGYVDHVIYRKPENGYTVFILVSEGDEITCVGTLAQIDQGDYLQIEGEEVSHAIYGSQIKVKSYRIVPPSDADSMERYLGSGAIKGVGPALAKRIVKRFGEDTFRIIEEEPERLVEVKGISERIARQISEQMDEKKEMREAIDAAIELNMPTLVILDFKGITFMDSSGIGLVMGRYRLLQKTGADLHITETPPNIYKVFRLSGIEKLAKLESR